MKRFNVNQTNSPPQHLSSVLNIQEIIIKNIFIDLIGITVGCSLIIVYFNDLKRRGIDTKNELDNA